MPPNVDGEEYDGASNCADSVQDDLDGREAVQDQDPVQDGRDC